MTDKAPLKTSITNGEDKMEVRMTFGLLHELAGLVGDIEVIPEIAYTQELREALLVAALSPRDEEGEISKPIKVKTLQSDPQEVEDLLAWIGEHVADFLVNSLSQAHKTMMAREEKIKGLTSMPGGGEG